MEATGLILLLSFLVRVFNLNYNSPFSDEAIYIVLGKMGLFQWDWTTFAAGNWMAGSLFAYPPLTALGYTLMGIVGSRFINVIFGVLGVYTLGRIAGLLATKKQAKTAPIYTMIVFGFSGVAILVSRLATYDMPAFYFLFQSLYYVLKGNQEKENWGKWYFLSAVTLVMAVGFKVIVIAYAPFIFGLTYYQLRLNKLNKKKRFFWRWYYLFPLIVLAALFVIFQGKGLEVYFATHQDSERVATALILADIWPYLAAMLPPGIVGGILLLRQKRYGLLITLTAASLWIIGLHLLAHRLSTLDKHLYFTQAFVALLAGIGMSTVVKMKKLIYPFLLLMAIVSIYQGHRYGSTWENTNSLGAALHNEVQKGDIILSVEGPVTMLAAYQVNHPSLVTTFDWISYQGFEGLDAYARAVKDAHFNLIMLYQDIGKLNESYQKVQTVVAQNLDKAYQPVFQDNNFIVYRRIYD